MIFLYLVEIVVFMVLAGIFSGIETAFISSSRLKAKQKYHRLERLFLRPERTLALVLAATNLSLVISAVLATKLFLKLKIYPVSLWVSVILSPLGLVFSEALPKVFGRHFKEKALHWFFPLFQLGGFILHPLVMFLAVLGAKVSRLLGRKAALFSRDDVKIMTETIYSQGIIETAEKEAIEDILGLSRQRIKDVAKDLSQVVTIDINDSKEEVLAKAKRYRYTRYPIFSRQKLSGYLNIFDVFYQEDDEPWQKLVRKIVRVGFNQRVYPVLTDMVQNKENMAAVLKGKRVWGIVTLSDLVRQVSESLSLPEEK